MKYQFFCAMKYQIFKLNEEANSVKTVEMIEFEKEKLKSPAHFALSDDEENVAKMICLAALIVRQHRISYAGKIPSALNPFVAIH